MRTGTADSLEGGGRDTHTPRCRPYRLSPHSKTHVHKHTRIHTHIHFLTCWHSPVSPLSSTGQCFRSCSSPPCHKQHTSLLPWQRHTQAHRAEQIGAKGQGRLGQAIVAKQCSAGQARGIESRATEQQNRAVRREEQARVDQYECWGWKQWW